MKRVFCFLIIFFLFVSWGVNAHALAFGIQTPQDTIQSRIDEFTTARKAYEQLKIQSADEATLVIQGRVVFDAMLDVFDIALATHEDQFDALQFRGATDEAVYTEHKARIKRARKWIQEQHDLVKSAKTVSDLRDRKAAFSEEWRAFRRDAMIARSALLVKRAELFLGKAGTMRTVVLSAHSKLKLLNLTTSTLDEGVQAMDEHYKTAQNALTKAQGDLARLRDIATVSRGGNDSQADFTAVYTSLFASLKDFRASVNEARSQLGVFRTTLRNLGK